MRIKKIKANKKRLFAASQGMASTTGEKRAEHDFYATDPIAIDCLIEGLGGFDYNGFPVWECACGDGSLSKRLIERGYNVISSDLYDYGYGTTGIDFLNVPSEPDFQHIVTNPPFSLFSAFVEKAMSLVEDGCYVCFIGRLQILESIERYKLFQKYPLYKVLVFSRRLKCAKNGDFERYGESMQAYAWFVWKKGISYAVHKPVISWVNVK